MHTCIHTSTPCVLGGAEPGSLALEICTPFGAGSTSVSSTCTWPCSASHCCAACAATAAPSSFCPPGTWPQTMLPWLPTSSLPARLPTSSLPARLPTSSLPACLPTSWLPPDPAARPELSRAVEVVLQVVLELFSFLLVLLGSATVTPEIHASNKLHSLAGAGAV